MSNMPFIHADNLSVAFRAYAADRSLKRALLNSSAMNLGGKREKGSVQALDNLSFEIRSGEKVGLFGHNGSGKTTLLRSLTGAFAPTSGNLSVCGRVTSLLDISLGLQGDASGWENIYLRGLLMGMAPDEIRKNINRIAEFSGLGAYLDLPLRTYSSGMQMRLAFSVSTAVTTDILLLDEWLSVGDDDFQEKSSTKLKELIGGSSIIVIASHSMKLLQEICSRIITLENGKVKSDELLECNERFS